MCVGSESRKGRFVGFSRRSQNAMRQWEANFDIFLLVIVELGSTHTLAILGGNSGSANDLDGLVTRAMTTSHIIIKCVDSSIKTGISILSIHVMGSTA